VNIVPGSACTHEQRRTLATALVAEFGHQYPDWTIDDAVEELATPGPLPTSFVALDGTTPLGCASLLEDDEVTDWSGHVWLGNVVVLESARGRGIGSALVSTIEEHASSLGIPELHLVTASAIDWYERRGWNLVGDADVHGHAMSVMRKSL
jgi:GNAT superfamily N-acetyltransferase